MRTARWLETIGYVLLVGVLLVAIVAREGQRREALDAKAAAAVARVDAELATARWQEAQQRCATR